MNTSDLKLLSPVKVGALDLSYRVGQAPVASSYLRKIFKGPIMAAGGFDREGAEDILQRGDADLVAFGRWFSSNPDLPERFRHDHPLWQYVRDAFWDGDERAYIHFMPFAA
jgi:N-ethylmaleimide reductase